MRLGKRDSRAARDAGRVAGIGPGPTARKARWPAHFPPAAPRRILPSWTPALYAIKADRIWIETQHAIALADANTVADGHMIVAPRKFVSTIHALPIPEVRSLATGNLSGPSGAVPAVEPSTIRCIDRDFGINCDRPS